MQPQPSISEILVGVARVLEREVVPATAGAAQHQARVAANLIAIVERELRLAPAAADRERESIARFLSQYSEDHRELRRQLATRLREQDTDSVAAWALLKAAVEDDLAIVRPGYNAWTGG